MEEMTETNNNNQNFLSVLIPLLWNKKYFIIKFCCIWILISVIYIFSLPRQYKSTVTMLPELTSQTEISGSLGALASMAGVKIGGGSKDAIAPEFYPKVLSSTIFMVELLSTKVQLESGEKVTLYDYLDSYQKSPWWDLFGFFVKKQDARRKTQLDPFRLTKKQLKIVKKMQKSLFCKVDKKTDLITIEVTLQDAEIASYIANQIQEKLTKYIIDYRTSKLRNDLNYISKVVDETYIEYIDAEKAYVDYADANRDAFLEKNVQETENLKNQLQLAYTAYSQAVQQKQLTKARLQERTPVFVVIQPATVPVLPSEPKRVVFVFVMSVFSFILSTGWVVLKNLYLIDFMRKYKIK